MRLNQIGLAASALIFALIVAIDWSFVTSAEAETLIRNDFDLASVENGAITPSNLPATFGGVPVGFGGIGGPVGFIAPFSGTLDMTVTDCCAGLPNTVGDVYEVFLNGVTLGYTPIVDLYDPNLTGPSKHFFHHVDAGPNTYDITDLILSYIGATGPFGFWPLSFNSIVDQEFSPAGVSVNLSITPDPTPLPAALPLFASGIGAIGLLGWRRKKKAAALAA